MCLCERRTGTGVSVFEGVFECVLEEEEDAAALEVVTEVEAVESTQKKAPTPQTGR